MTRILSARDSAERATTIFRTFDEGEPELYDLGIPAITRAIGGMFPGNMVGLGAGQNVGKSSMILSMAMHSEDKVGVVELEDGPDVWGARLLAWHTGVNPTKIRRKDLTAEERELIREAKERKDLKGPLIVYAIGGSVDDIEDATKRLVKAGCRVVFLNYLQKSRGHHSERRVEVGNTMYAFLRASAPREEDDYPGCVPVLVSQLTRIAPDKEPYPSHMKESGDIEAECRLIVMLWRDSKDHLTVRVKVAKSSFGGGGLRFDYRYGRDETLRPIEYDDEPAADPGDEEF
jgi:replicative DNA helicase